MSVAHIRVFSCVPWMVRVMWNSMRNKLVFNKKANKEQWKRCKNQVHYPTGSRFVLFIYFVKKFFFISCPFYFSFHSLVGYLFSLLVEIWIELNLTEKKRNTSFGRCFHTPDNGFKGHNHSYCVGAVSIQFYLLSWRNAKPAIKTSCRRGWINIEWENNSKICV